MSPALAGKQWPAPAHRAGASDRGHGPLPGTVARVVGSRRHPMGEPETLRFESRLRTSPEHAWQWATSAHGIRTELRPLARMTVPQGVESILDLDVELGKPLGRTWIFLFGLLPLDRVDLTLVELEEGRRFVEQSPMSTMRLWRHERRVDPVPGGARIEDRLTFEPILARGLLFLRAETELAAFDLRETSYR